MLYWMSSWSSWRDHEANDGASGGVGGGDSGASSPAEPPPAPVAPQPDPRYAEMLVLNARLQARVAYPQADAAELDKHTDPAAIDAIARFSHEAAVAKQGQSQAGAAVPVPSDNATRAAESEEQRRIRKLQHEVRQRMRPGYRGGRTTIDQWEAEDLRDLAFKVSWNAHMEHRRSGRGNVSHPPTGAPPVAPAQSIPAMGRAF